MTRVVLLVFAAMIWGMGFIATKWTLVDYSATWSNALRFAIAGIISLPYLLYRKTFHKSWDFLKAPLVAGTFMWLAMHLQTVGLEHTTASMSGFLTALYALFAPILAMAIFHKRYEPSFWLLLVLALMGICMLSDFNLSALNYGDGMTIMCAFFFAVHIIYVGRIAKNYDPVELNCIQCSVIGVISIVYGILFEGLPNLEPLTVWNGFTQPSALLGFISVGFFSSLVAFSIQAYAQQEIPSHIVGLIFLLESVFAAVFASFFLSETLSWVNWLGAGVMLGAVALLPIFGKEVQQPSGLKRPITSIQ